MLKVGLWNLKIDNKIKLSNQQFWNEYFTVPQQFPIKSCQKYVRWMWGWWLKGGGVGTQDVSAVGQGMAAG